VRGMLDEMGPAVVENETDALNLTRVPPRKDARLDDYSIEVTWSAWCGPPVAVICSLCICFNCA
jgi:hypothetical protein